MPDLGIRSIENWPLMSRESARRVIDQYGEPDEVTDNQLIWRKRGPWRQIVASKTLYQHNFPAPHYALFELEPKQEEAVEQKPQRARPQKGYKIKLASNSGYDKPALPEGSLASTPLSTSALNDADLAKGRVTLRNKPAHAAGNSSAA